jgi:hypothetical protein
MFRDHRVDFRREEVVSAEAGRLRELAGVSEEARLDVVSLIYWLQANGWRDKGKLSLKVWSERPKGKRAFVTFSPLALNIERRTLELARWQHDSESRYVIAHEIGHVVLHDHNAKPFSDEDIKYSKFGFEETSAEWQADRFADHLLLPDNILAGYESIEQIVIECAVSPDLAERRFPKKKSLELFRSRFMGDPCPECFGFTLLRNGGFLECDRCGASRSGL